MVYSFHRRKVSPREVTKLFGGHKASRTKASSSKSIAEHGTTVRINLKVSSIIPHSWGHTLIQTPLLERSQGLWLTSNPYNSAAVIGCYSHLMPHRLTCQQTCWKVSLSPLLALRKQIAMYHRGTKKWTLPTTWKFGKRVLLQLRTLAHTLTLYRLEV